MAIFDKQKKRKKTPHINTNVANLNSTKLFEYIKQSNWNKVKRRCKNPDRVDEVHTWVMTSLDFKEDKNKKRKDKNSSKSDNRFSGYGYDDDEEEEVYVAKSNLLPIHLLLFNRKAPLDVVKAVVEAYPNGLSEKDSYGRTPLHIAIVEGCNASVVKFILSRNPGMASEKDFNGEIPLHNVLQIWSLMTNNGDSYFDEILSVIHALVEAYPKGINDSNIDGMTPMRIVKMMEVMDDENNGDGNKFHLLHFLEGKESKLSAEKIVVVSKDTDLVVDELLSKARKTEVEKKIELGKVHDSKPQSEVKEQEINSPKHLEPVSKLTKKSIEYKTKKVVSTVPINTNRLFTFFTRKDWLGATKWIENHPEEADLLYEYEDKARRYPLMEAIMRKASVICVNALMQASVRGVLTCNPNGDLPIHVAVQSHSPKNVIEVLLQNEYRATAEKSDNFGNLPLHYAYKYDHKDAVYLLLLTYPEALNLQNKEGLVPMQLNSKYTDRISSIVPIWRADERTESWILQYLVDEKWEEIISLCTSDKNLVQQWCVSIELNNTTGKEEMQRNLPIHLALAFPTVPFRVVETLFNGRPYMRYSRNHNGMLPIHIAAKSGVSLKIINFLLKGFGKTAQVKDYFEKFAAQYAWDNGHDVITFKLRQEFDDEDNTINDEVSTLSWDLSEKIGKDDYFKLVENVGEGSSGQNIDLMKKNQNIENEQTKRKKKKRAKKKIESELVQYMQAGNWPKALMYLKSDRNYAKEIVETKLGQFRWNRTILHESLRLTPPKNIIQELILAYPEAITMKESLNGRIPLHIACETGHVDIIQLLLDADISTAGFPDSEGCLSIHLASMAGCGTDTFFTLLAANPESINHENDEGMTPTELSKVVQYSNKMEIVKILTTAKDDYDQKYSSLKMSEADARVAFTAGLKHVVGEKSRHTGKTDEDSNGSNFKIVEGQTQLAEFISCRDWISVMARLTDDDDIAFRESITWIKVQLKNFETQQKLLHKYMMPVHMATLLQAPKKIVGHLMAQVRKVIPPSEPEGDTLTHLVAKYHPKTAIFQLLETSNSNVLDQNSNGENPLHSACDARPWGSLSNEYDVAPNKFIIQSLLDLNETLAAVKDQNGNLPLHLFVANCRPKVLPKLSILKALLMAYPSAVNKKNADGETPLNIFHKNEFKYIEQPAIYEKREIARALLRDVEYWETMKSNEIKKKNSCLNQSINLSIEDMKSGDNDQGSKFQNLESYSSQGLIESNKSKSLHVSDKSLKCQKSYPSQSMIDNEKIKDSSDLNTFEFEQNEDDFIVHFNEKQKHVFEILLRTEGDVGQKSRMMLQELAYTRAHQKKIREERKREEERLARIEAERIRKIMEKGATDLQRIWRGFKVYTYTAKLRKSVIFLQAQYRRNASRKSYIEYRNDVIECQAATRMLLARRYYHKVIEALPFVQSFCKSVVKAIHKRKIFTACIIQAHVRRFLAQCRYIRIYNSILELQIRFREKKAEREWLKKMEERGERNRRRIMIGLEKERKLQAENRQHMREKFKVPARILRKTTGPKEKTFGLTQLDFRGTLKPVSKKAENKEDNEDDPMEIFVFKEKENATVLHSWLNAYIIGKKWGRALQRVNEQSGECSLWIVQNEHGKVWKRLPIHAACKLNPTKDIIDEMLMAYPDSASYKDNLGALPLHYAAANGASAAVVESLLKYCPVASNVKDRDGNTPLDYFDASTYDCQTESEAVLEHLQKPISSWGTSMRSIL